MAATIRSFLAELKRRRVYHVAVAYVVVGLGVLGAAEVILDPLGLESVRPVIVVLTLLGFPIALVLAWAYELRPEQPRAAAMGDLAAGGRAASDPPDGAGDIEVDRPAAPQPHGIVASTGEKPAVSDKSIAVLPFDDLSPEGDQEYFVHGLSEEIINALTRIRDLKVAARTSAFALARTNADITAIAGTLGVANVLEGSVRKAGDRIRITAQLIEAGSGFHLWSDTFDRELTDIFEIQDEIARAIANRLRATLAPELQRHLVAEATGSREAHEAYLRGRYLLNRRSRESMRSAISEFQRAIELDPGYAEAFSGLAEAFLLVDGYTPTAESLHFHANMERGLAAARTAVSLAPGLGMARLSLGMGLWTRGEWEDTRREMERAIELNPGYAAARMGMAVLALSTGRPAEALDHARRAAELDPVSPVIIFTLGLALRGAGRTREAIERFRAALALAPGLWNAWFFLAAALLEAEEFEEGSEAWEGLGRAFQVGGSPAWGDLYRAAVRWHETGEPQALAQPEWTPPVMSLVWLYAHTGHPDQATRVLDEYLVRQGAYGWASLAHYGVCSPLEEYPDYNALLEEVGILGPR